MPPVESSMNTQRAWLALKTCRLGIRRPGMPRVGERQQKFVCRLRKYEHHAGAQQQATPALSACRHAAAGHARTERM